MITLRKAVALTATSALAVAGLVAGTASAQSSQVAINTSVVVSAVGAPANITGYNVIANCTAPTSSSQIAAFPAAGGAAIPLFFTVSAANSCTFTVNGLVGGTVSNPSAASVVATVGGSVRGTMALGGTTGSVAIAAGTTAVFTITYPNVTIKKVVVGEEIVPGSDYEMAVACYYNNFGLAGSTKFKLKAAGTKVVTTGDIPGLVAGATCHVAELTNGGAAGTAYSATKADGTTVTSINLPLVFTVVGPPASTESFNPFTTAGISGVTFASAGFTADGQTATVTNSFVGDLIVSKVVTGDPKTSIAIYEINVSCNNNGPKETFLLKDRQSKLFSGIASGTSCLVSETRSDGAEASYNDNSGDNTTDGRVTIKGTAAGCIDRNLSAFPDCRANVIVTNSYVVATTTAAPTTAAATTAPAATLAPVAPAVVEEVEELDAEEEVTG
jgi:Domain of unknown function (DUF5979)